MPERTGPAYRYQRWFQFRLRTLFVLLIAASFGMTWVHWHLDSYRRQRQAVEAVSGFARYAAFAPGQPRLLQWVADDSFRDAVHLSFQGRRGLKDEHLAHLEKMPRLQRLSLQRTRVSDQGLRHLAGLAELDTLSLESTAVTSQGLRELGHLPRLRMLQLNDTAVDDLTPLTQFPSLEVLEVVTKRGVRLDAEVFARLPKLRMLEIGKSHWGQADNEGWSALQALEELTIRASRLEHPRLESLPKLKSLRMQSGHIGNVTLKDLPRLRELIFAGRLEGDLRLDVSPLTSLSLSGQRVSEETMASLSRLPELRDLNLDRSQIVPGGRRYLGELRSLRTLHLNFAGITDDDLQFIAPLSFLETLSLARNPIRGSGLRHLSQLNNLKLLDLSGTELFEHELLRSPSGGSLRDSPLFADAFAPDECCEHLLAMQSLESLSLTGTRATFQEMHMLRELPRLKYLQVDGERLSQDERSVLERELPGIVFMQSEPEWRLLRGYRQMGGWQPQALIQRIRQAMSEINRAAVTPVVP